MSIITARDLSIGWSRDAVLLEHASFTVEPGEIFGILGRSGSGKSTLFRVMIGLEQPLGGELEMTSAPSVPGAPPFGVMFQQGAMFGSMTVGENVALALDRWTDLPHDAVRAIARAKLRLVGLDTIIDRCILLDLETRSILASGAPRELHASPHPRVQRFLSREPEVA